MDLYNLTAIELSKKIKAKEVSATEAVKSAINRIKDVDGEIHAFITHTNEIALETAQRVDEKIKNNEIISPLAGIPIGIKDNICTKDIKTTAASKMLADFIPPYNATVINKINNLDMPILGKLNMDEFAMGSSTESSYFFKTKNPIDLTRSPGGSSGGSAVAVAAREVQLALGTDTGGSIRQPASYTGTVGLKPTYGSVSRYGIIAYASSFDQVSPIGRTVKDVAFLYENICGHDEKDSTTFFKKYNTFTNSMDGFSPKGMKIGIPKEFYGDGVDKNVKDSVIEEIKKLEKNGAEIIDVNIPSVEYALAIYYIIATAQASSNLGRLDGVRYGHRTDEYKDLDEMYEKSRSEGFGSEVKKRIMLGTHILNANNYTRYYKNAILMQNKMKQEFLNAFSKVDILITPTTPTTAFKLGENSNNPLQMYASDICTTTANITGLPAMSIPCGKDSNNLPMGMQLIAPHFKEDAIFKLGHFYETLVSGFKNITEV